MASRKVQVKRQIDATAEQVAKVRSLAAKPPDPSKRIMKRRSGRSPKRPAPAQWSVASLLDNSRRLCRHHGRTFTDTYDDDDDFFAYGLGTMCWSFDSPGRRVLWVIAPCPSESHGWELARVSVMNDGKDWAQPGDGTGTEIARRSPRCSGGVIGTADR